MKHKGYFLSSYLLLKMLLAFGALLAVQVAFYACNTSIFQVDSASEWLGIIWGNVVFGLATVATFYSPFLILMVLPVKARQKRWYRTVAEVFYIVATLLILIPRGDNMAYYQFTYRLLSDEIFSYIGVGGDMGTLIPLFAVDYWYAWVIPTVIFILFLVLDCHLRLNKIALRRINTSSAGLLIALPLCYFFIRGGFGRFIQPADAAHYAQPRNTALVNNDAYNIFRTLLTPDLKEVTYYTDDALAAIYEPVHTSGLGPDSCDMTATASNTVSFAGRNVVLIVVESLSQEYMGCYNSQPDADIRTPFLDSLAQHSTLYNGRANGKKSIEGITAINTSIPNLMSIPLPNSAYNADTYSGLPAILGRHGYTTAFFHGSYNGVMNFDKTCAKIGFDHYLGQDEFNASPMAQAADNDGVWGIFDEPFLQYTLQQIGSYREPFFAEVFTVTSHHPYPIPEEYQGTFAEGRHPMLKCIEYADYALRRFFEQAQRQPWYDSTLFIITGDHSGPCLTHEYNGYDGWYRIPMIVFDPQHPVGRRSDRIVQQIDLLPTLVDWLAIDDGPILCFGQSVARPSHPGWQVYYGNGYHAMVSNNADNPAQHHTTVIMGDRETGSANDLQFLKAVIQQYNHRLINNQLTLP